MTYEEKLALYKERIKEEELRHKKELYEIARKFVASTMKFRKGQILRKDEDTMLVESIRIGKDLSDIPVAVYEGPLLKKNLQKRKAGRRSFWGCEGIELIKDVEEN